MFPYHAIHPLPVDKEVHDNEDLKQHNVHLGPCCDALEHCEDVILHVALHGTQGKPSVQDEHDLHENLSTAIRRKRGVFKKWDQR